MAVHPFAGFVDVRVYVVVVVGFATGLEISDALSPVVGDQEYVIPDTADIPI